ncbi:MAG TPA: hypothetical protein EYG95_04530 [Campylobacterales bacterium]|nr:hypothetical protein [Campylobacterales bacterium]
MDNYLKDLEVEMMKIVSDEKIPLTEKNKLMAPIADQKKVLVYGKKALLKIKDKEYKAECGMSAHNIDNLKGL